ncbi:B12-binding domain-containing radical SAM protein [bacterium]|nr:B12-binding domain-containing radical SAM protein [bacterium]
MAKVLIANSVGIDSREYAIIHSPSRWTNSTKNKNVFTYYPWELAYTSSLLKRETEHRVRFMDGCLLKFTVEDFFKKIGDEFRPDFMVMEPSTRTYLEDNRLMQMVKDSFGTKLIVVGQHATAFPEEVGKLADYVCLGEYEYTVLEILQGKERGKILGLYPNSRRPLLDVNTLPWPEDEDVRRIDYGLPGEPSCEYLEIQAYASRGCPFQCSFCVCANLYYAKPNWRPRDVEDIVAEVKHLRTRYPQTEGIFFDEETHTVKKDFIIQLTRRWIEEGLSNLKINAMCGYFGLDREMMEAMKEAGYYMLRVGIETASEKVARAIGMSKKFNLKRLMAVLRIGKEVGLKMYGTFLIGAPGSTKEDDEKTVRLLKRLIDERLLWSFQISICTPQPGTQFFKWAKEKGYLLDVNWYKFDGGNCAVVSYPDYPANEIESVFRGAEKMYDYNKLLRFRENKSKIKDELSKIGNYNRGLVVRSVPIEFFKEVCTVLNKSLRLLCQEGVTDDLKGIFKDTLVIKEGSINIDTLDLRLREGLKSEIDYCLIPVKNTKGQGYENVVDAFKQMGLKTFLISVEGELIER